jgi:hypothetical protein
MTALRTISKWQLFGMLAADRNAEPVEIFDSNGRPHSGLLSSVQREDGSGCSFNVTLSTAAGSETFHVRTKD